MRRLVDPAYYGGSVVEMVAALDEIRALGCSFLVAGRADGARFETMRDVDAPPDLGPACSPRSPNPPSASTCPRPRSEREARERTGYSGWQSPSAGAVPLILSLSKDIAIERRVCLREGGGGALRQAQGERSTWVVSEPFDKLRVSVTKLSEPPRPVHIDRNASLGQVPGLPSSGRAAPAIWYNSEDFPADLECSTTATPIEAGFDMAFRDLREFISLLEERGELVRVSTPVSADLEITEITDRMVKSGGPALLFENVEGHSAPALINLFGTHKRVALGLGVEDVEELADRARSLLSMAQDPPAGIGGQAPRLGRTGGAGEIAAQDRQERALSRSRRQRGRRRSVRYARHQMLADGRRALRHAAAGDKPRPGVRQAQRRHVQDAGLRPQHDGDALADAQGGGAARPARARTRHRAARCRRRAGRGPRHDVDRLDAASARLGRTRRRGRHTGRAGRGGQVQDGRFGSPRPRRIRAGRLRRFPANCATKGRSATTRATTPRPSRTPCST